VSDGVVDTVGVSDGLVCVLDAGVVVSTEVEADGDGLGAGCSTLAVSLGVGEASDVGVKVSLG
jgi:hypothetical protein